MKILLVGYGFLEKKPAQKPPFCRDHVWICISTQYMYKYIYIYLKGIIEISMHMYMYIHIYIYTVYIMFNIDQRKGM